MANNLRLNIVIQAIDHVTKPLRVINERLHRLRAPVRAVGGSFRNLLMESGLPRLTAAIGTIRERLDAAAKKAVMLGVAITGAAAGLAHLFKTQFVDTAAQFERFGAVLETLTGSAEKGKAALAWVSDFAERTPFEIDEVTAAFVKLNSYGIDATKGSLESAGNAAAAMGKTLDQAVEALADAMTGENERLKEFGIKARQHGNRIVYEYTNHGQTLKKVARANSREQMRAAIEGIWNEKYQGAMDRLSRTWTGVVSNLSDMWTRFKVAVMEAGVFDWLKGKLQGVLDTVNELAASGELQRWAKEVADRLVDGFEAVWQRLPDVWEGLKTFGENVKSLVDTLGGWKNAMIVAGGVLAGPFIAALIAAGAAFVTLGNVMMTTPFGWVLGGIALVAGAAHLIYKNWEPIKEFFLSMWDGVTERWQRFIDFVTGMWEKIKAPLDWLKRNLPEEVQPPATMEDFRARNRKILFGDKPPAWLANANSKLAQLSGEKAKAEVTVKFDNLPRGARVDAKAEPGVDLETEAGFAWGVP